MSEPKKPAPPRCRIVLGQTGIEWRDGDPVPPAAKAVMAAEPYAAAIAIAAVTLAVAAMCAA